MSNHPETPASTTTQTPPKYNLAPVIITSVLTVVAAVAAIYQNQIANTLQYDNGALTAKLERTREDLERTKANLMHTAAELEDAQAQVVDLTARVASVAPDEVALLEQALAAAEGEVQTLRGELATTRQALGEREAEVDHLASDILPPPPTVEILAPPPLYAAAADYGDPHVNVELDQYLTDLVSTLADDSKAPKLAALHPLGLLYDVDNDLLLQGTVGDSQRYRVTEWHALNDYQDIVLESLIIIDAPTGTNAAPRVQQALASTRGAGELNDEGLLTWEVGSKTITLHPTADKNRAMLRISDSYQLPEVMQVYNRE